MKTAEEYAEEAGLEMRAADLEPEIRMEHYAAAQVYATLAAAAATLEAARMAGPTPQELAVLDALTAPEEAP